MWQYWPVFCVFCSDWDEHKECQGGVRGARLVHKSETLLTVELMMIEAISSATLDTDTAHRGGSQELMASAKPCAIAVADACTNIAQRYRVHLHQSVDR